VVHALEDVSFAVRPGETFIVLGPSGCGKSTLLKAVAGFLRPSAGQIRLDGQPITWPGPDRVVVFQEFDQLLPWRTVLGNVSYPLRVARKVGRVWAAERARRFVEMVGLAGFADAYPHTLSGGMKQRVAIALVFVTAATLSRAGRDLLETLTGMFNPLPAIALLPLALLWFGLGTNSLIFVLVHSVLWPLSLNAYTGFVTVPPTLVRVGQNLGLGGFGLVTGILVPAAFPYLLTGLKIGWAFAWRTVIAAELVFGVAGERGGLGWYIYRNRYDLNTAEVFAGLLTIIAIGLLVESLVFRSIERRTVVRWGMHAQAGAMEAD
jgi:NitT/TauT family transport system permease protein